MNDPKPGRKIERIPDAEAFERYVESVTGISKSEALDQSPEEYEPFNEPYLNRNRSALSLGIVGSDSGTVIRLTLSGDEIVVGTFRNANEFSVSLVLREGRDCRWHEVLPLDKEHARNNRSIVAKALYTNAYQRELRSEEAQAIINSVNFGD